MKIQRTKKQSDFNDAISATFSIARPVWGVEEGKKILEVFEKNKETFWPDQFSTLYGTSYKFKSIESKENLLGIWEPFWRKFHGNSEEIREEIWVDDIWLRRTKSPKVDVKINPQWMERVKSHCGLTIDEKDGYFTKHESDEPLLWKFLLDVAEYTECDFGSVHSAPAAKEKSRSYGKLKWGEEPFAHVTSSLIKKIPGVYLINIFGPPYIELLGRKRLLSAPCCMVKELNCGSIWIQLLPGLPRSTQDYKVLEKNKKMIREYLNNNTFNDPMLPASHKYNVPKFDLSALKAPIDVPKPDVVPWI